MTFDAATVLPLIFMGVMGLALLAYVVLDGYDLGVGILLPFARDDQKDVMVSSIGPFWDANETWLVLGIGILLTAFPIAHGIILTSLYLPVALMLIGLGVRAIAVAARQGPSGPVHEHHHGQVVHVHRGAAAHIHVGAWTLARRPLLVGAVHGLAGSGALTALVLTTLPTPAAQLTYMVVFGLGSTVGMAALSGVLGWPLARVGRNRALARGVSATVGCVSIVLGVVWGIRAL